ncbi:MAG: hypothetical protein RLZZ352_1818 [Pseudomonadota bacterium]|jgi:hypothetical protein
MRSHVTVTWGEPRSYRFDLEEVQPMPHEAARLWLDEQFVALQCEPIRATGKVLTADKVLCVAQGAGEARFRDAEHQDWALNFAKAASAALAKPVVVVDVQDMNLAY